MKKGVFYIMSNRKIYRKIAKENHVSVTQVKQEMQDAINHSYQNAPNDGVTKAYQNRVPRKDTVPTVDEFLTYVKNELKK